MVEQVVRTGSTFRGAVAHLGDAAGLPGAAPAGLRPEDAGRHRSTGPTRVGMRTAAAAALFSLPTGAVAAAIVSPELPGAEDTAALKADLAANTSPLADKSSAESTQSAMSIVPQSPAPQTAAGMLQAASAAPMSGEQIVQLQRTPAPQQIVEDDSMAEGTKTVVDPGREGARSTIWRVSYVGGKEVSRERIGDLVELFESRCADVVASQRGRVIKSIGDSVLFVNDDPVRALETGEQLIDVIGRDS